MATERICKEETVSEDSQSFDLEGIKEQIEIMLEENSEVANVQANEKMMRQINT